MKRMMIATVALLLSAAPAFAFDAPKVPGAYGVAGTGGVAAVTGTVTGDSQLNVTVNDLTGGDGGLGVAVAIGDGLVSFAQGGNGGGAGSDFTVKDGGKVKLDVRNIDGGWGGDAIAANLDNLKVVLPPLKVVIE